MIIATLAVKALAIFALIVLLAKIAQRIEAKIFDEYREDNESEVA